MSTEERTEERDRVNWVQVIAAALAAMSSAVLLSTLGVAGTILGAAVGSLIASVGGAVYTRTLDASKQHVLTQAAALRRVAQARSDVDAAVASMRRGDAGADTSLRRADRALSEAEHALSDPEPEVSPDTGADPRKATGPAAHHPSAAPGTAETAPVSWRDRFPWKRIALLAAGIFVTVMIAITAFELATGRAVSSYTGGSDSDKQTTVPGLRDSKSTRDDSPEPTPAAEPTATATTDSDDRLESPTPSPTESPTSEPTSPSPSLTETPTPSPSITLDPTLTAPPD